MRTHQGQLAGIFSRIVSAAILSLICITLLTAQADALTINLTFDSGASDSPAFDPAGSNVGTILRAAADYWEDIIQDTWTLDIRYYYDDLSDATGTLADHLNEGTSSGKPTDARLRFDTQTGGTARDWWFDPTPTNNSEFNIEQTLYRDLGGIDQGNWFNGSPPDVLEVGYRGTAVAGGVADGHYDIFSTAIHELGHAVGLTGNVSSGEYADGDYDVPSNFVGGATMAIEGDFHLDCQVALMCGSCGAESLRRLPTATDVFAAATGSGWTNLDLPRQDWIGGINSSWNTAGNWEGDAVPGSLDEAYIRLQDSNPTVTLTSGNGYCTSLFVGEGDNVNTGSYKLGVGGTVTVDGLDSDIMVSASGELEANRVEIQNQAEVYMTGGLIDANYVDIDAGTWLTLNGSGNTATVDVQARLVNNGIIRAQNGASLTLTSSGGAVWDLDGGGDGIVEAISGDVNFASGSLYDAFDGTMRIGEGHVLTIAQPWTLGASGGLIDLNGGADYANRARIAGGLITASAGTISATGEAHIDSQITLSGAAVSVPGASDVLELNAATTYDGGSYTGSGKLTQDGDATVTGDTTIGVGTYDMDGDGGSTTITVEAFNILTLNVTNIDAGNDTFNGTLNLDGGGINVNVADNFWTMAGTLNMDSTSGAPAVSGDYVTVSGTLAAVGGTNDFNAEVYLSSPTVTVDASSYLQFKNNVTFNGGSYTGDGRISVYGSADVSNDTTIDTMFRTVAGSSVSVPTGITLTLNGDAEYYGATLSGLGQITQNGDANVLYGGTTVSVDVYDWDGTGTAATTINSGTTLTLDVTNIDLNGIDQFDGTINNSGALAVSVGDNLWAMDGVLNITGGTLSGDRVYITGAINATSGTSTIESDMHLRNASITTVSGGATLSATGVTEIEAGSSTTVDGTLQLNGTTNWHGPATMTGTGILQQNGASNIEADTSIFVTTYDWDGAGASVTNLNPDVTLSIYSDKIDQGTPSLDGYDGTINMATASRLYVYTLDPWLMEGSLNMAFTTGSNFTMLYGTKMIVRGDVNVTGTGESGINCEVDFESTAAVTVAADADLELNGTTTYKGGSYTGAGTLRQDGPAIVEAATTIDVDTFDMDGSSEYTSLTLNESLTLNVSKLDASGSVFNGTLNINNPGRLTVNGPGTWTMAGTMNLDQNGNANQYLVMGDEVNVSGVVNVTGATAFGTSVNLTGIIDLGAAGDFIQIGGGSTVNTIAGGSIDGPGTYAQVGGSMTGYGTISADMDFAPSASLKASGGTLEVSGAITAMGVIGTAGATGVLNVTNAWNTSVAERLELNGGQVIGAAITNSGLTIGRGTIATSNFDNLGTLTALGGTLTLSTTNTPDLDGSGTEGGVINTNGNLVHVTNTFGGLFNFNGILNIASGGEFRMDSYGLSINATGTPGEIHFSGGEYTAPYFYQGSVLTTASATSTIDAVTIEFLNGSDSTLDAHLWLDGAAVIEAGADFRGSGRIIVGSSSTLDLEDGATVGAGVINYGQVNVGSSPGSAKVAYFGQNSYGTLAIELADTGTAGVDYDQLIVTGSAPLGGVLELSYDGGFVASPGDSFMVLDADSLTGTFATVDYPDGQFWFTHYNTAADFVLVGVALPGDADLDGDVDLADFNILKSNFNTGTTWAQANFDGDAVVDLDDFNLLKGNFTGVAPIIPEPTSAIVLLVGAVGMASRRRRK